MAKADRESRVGKVRVWNELLVQQGRIECGQVQMWMDAANRNVFRGRVRYR